MLYKIISYKVFSYARQNKLVTFLFLSIFLISSLLGTAVWEQGRDPEILSLGETVKLMSLDLGEVNDSVDRDAVDVIVREETMRFLCHWYKSLGKTFMKRLSWSEKLQFNVECEPSFVFLGKKENEHLIPAKHYTSLLTDVAEIFLETKELLPRYNQILTVTVLTNEKLKQVNRDDGMIPSLPRGARLEGQSLDVGISKSQWRSFFASYLDDSADSRFSCHFKSS